MVDGLLIKHVRVNSQTVEVQGNKVRLLLFYFILWFGLLWKWSNLLLSWICTQINLVSIFRVLTDDQGKEIDMNFNHGTTTRYQGVWSSLWTPGPLVVCLLALALRVAKLGENQSCCYQQSVVRGCDGCWVWQEGARPVLRGQRWWEDQQEPVQRGFNLCIRYYTEVLAKIPNLNVAQIPGKPIARNGL